tara:strand:+ start:372 stop:1967 length:1596 start_codon:yes stop_codon:yes gene_type:complete
MLKLKRWVATPTIKMAFSLRSAGYDYMSALADIIDNCFDADATKICIWLDASKDESAIEQINISDNGYGMSLEDLQSALTYGSDSAYGQHSLGCYGLGLKTASTSIGKRLTVYTKTRSGKLLVGFFDLDRFEEEGDYVVEYTDDPTAEQQALFAAHVGDSPTASGTLVVISKIDKLDIKPKSFYQTLKAAQNLPRVFREFLANPEIEMYINKTRVEGYIVPPESIVQNWAKIPNTEVEFRILHDRTRGASGHDRRQGISSILIHDRNIIRYRQIKTHGVWKPTWSLSAVFAELRGTRGAFEGMLETNFRKSEVTLTQSFLDRLKDVVGPIVKPIQVERESRGKRKRQENDDVKGRMEKKLQQTVASRMTMPEIKNENVLSPPGNESQKDTSSAPEAVTRPTRGPDRTVRRRRLGSGEQLVLEWFDGGRHGRFVEVPTYEHSKKRYTLKINADHPWVLSRLFKGCPDSVIATALDFIMAFGLEEMATSDAGAYDAYMAAISMRLAQVVSATEEPNARDFQVEESILDDEQAA